MSTRLVVKREQLPREFTIETYADGTAWIVWADGRQRHRLDEYARLVDERCRGKGDGRDGECGTFPGYQCNRIGNPHCVGRPGLNE